MYQTTLKSFIILCLLSLTQNFLSAQCLTPYSLRALNLMTTEATLQWNAMSATSYEVELTQSGGAKTVVMTSTAQMYEGFLLPITTYSYRVRATCPSGVSAWSSPNAFTTTGDPNCGRPQTSSTTNVTATTATINWSPVVGVQSYLVVLSNGTRKTVNNATNLILAGLNANATYTYQIFSQCGSMPSNATTGSFTTSNLTCATPSNVAVSNIGVNKATITYANVPFATSYKIEFKENDAASYTAVTSGILTNLTPNKAHFYRVSAVCSGIQSTPSAATIFATAPTPACAAVPSNVTVSTTTAFTSKLTWTAVPGASAYRVTLQAPNGTSTVFNTSSPSYTLAGLTPLSPYTFKVNASCGTDQGLQSAAVSFSTLAVPAACLAPANITISNIAQEKAKVSWTAPPGSSFCKLLVKDLTTNQIYAYSTPGDNVNISALSPNSLYCYSVAPTCGANANIGNYTTPVNFNTMALDMCDKVAGLKKSNVTTNSVTFNWDANPKILQWKLQINKVGSNSISYMITNKTSLTITGLLENTAYSFNVTSMCAASSISEMNTLNFSTASSTLCSDVNEPNETMSAAIPISTNSTTKGTIGIAGDKDMFSFTVTNPNEKYLYISLTDLPSDYDLSLYNSQGILIASSLAYYIQSEYILKSDLTVGKYYIKVASSAIANNFVANSCYKLGVVTSENANIFTNFFFGKAKENTSILAQNELKYEEPINISTLATTQKAAEDKFENLNTLDFILAPNPAESEVIIAFGTEVRGDLNVTLSDLTGRLVKRFKHNTSQDGNQLYVNLNDLEDGLYIVNVDNGKFHKASKLVVNK